MIIVDLSYLTKHYKDIREGYTVRDIIKEAKSEYFKKLLANIKFLSVEKEYIEKIKEKALEVGILDYLSNTDIKICALALKYKDKAKVLTNDFYIQNLCYFLGIKFDGDRKIKYAKIFRYYCDKCKILNKTTICPKCGNIGVRKVIKIFKINY